MTPGTKMETADDTDYADYQPLGHFLGRTQRDKPDASRTRESSASIRVIRGSSSPH